MPKIVRWGLMSTARINDKVMPSFKNSERGKLVAVGSRDLKKAKRYARRKDIPLFFGSYEELINSPEIDAVYISLPHHLHKEWAIKAQDAGKHVLCEKPFALSVADVDEMFEASKRNKTVLQEAFMYLHHPQMKIVKKFLNERNLGDVHLVRAFFSFRLDNHDDIRMVPEFGGGSIWDVGVYPISLAQYIFGETPEEVSARQISNFDNNIDLSFFGTLKFSGDRMAQIGSSFTTPYYTFAEIFGSKGHLVMPNPFNNLDKKRKIYWYDTKGKKHAIKIPRQSLYQGEVENMHDAILDSAATLVTHKHTRGHIQTVRQLLDAAKK